MQIAVAVPSQAEEIFHLTNKAYEVETGDTGVAFKKTLRFLTVDEILPSIEAGRVFVAIEEETKHIVGMIAWELQKEEDGSHSMHFGPFAVLDQRRGIGKRLMQAVEAEAAKRGLPYISISVVNHRSDLLVAPNNIYERRGFVPYGSGEFPAPERTTRPSSFVLMRKATDMTIDTSLSPAP